MNRSGIHVVKMVGHGCGEVNVAVAKRKKDTWITWLDSRTATIPWQRRQKACWYMLTQTDKFASAWIP